MNASLRNHPQTIKEAQMRPFANHGVSLVTLILLTGMLVAAPAALVAADRDWHFNGTVIEACSCPMFCQCYFNPEPALRMTAEGPEHFCKFNMAYKINEGHYGDTDLAGVKFWVAGDLGETWKDGTTEWAVVTFQTGTSEAQKAGVTTALQHIFPVKWQSFTIGEDAAIQWTATDERAEAQLAGGRKAHIILNRWQGMGGRTAVFENLAYFAAPRNNGFKMWPNTIESWKVGDQAFEFSGTTGFMVTIDMKSADVSM
jgi:hypothetical protein